MEGKFKQIRDVDGKLHHSQAYKDYIGKRNKGRKFPKEEYPNKGWRGKKHTQEYKDLVSKALTGKPKPEGFGTLISKKRKGMKFTQIHCDNISRSNLEFNAKKKLAKLHVTTRKDKLLY